MPQRRNAFALDAQPSDQELISSFLVERASSGAGSEKNSRGFVHEADVYSTHPADLTRRYGAALASNGDEAWYFFSAVRAKGGGRRARTVDSGDGCWHSEAGSKPVVSAHLGGLVGHRQNFSFVTKEDGVRVRSGWLMVELGLHGDGQDEVTLCKVYFSPRAAAKNQHRKPASSSSPSATRKRKAAAPADARPPAGQRRRHATPEAEAAAASSGSEMVVDDDPVPVVEPPGEDPVVEADAPVGVVGGLARFLASLRQREGIISVEQDFDRRPPENVGQGPPPLPSRLFTDELPSSFTELLLHGPDEDEDEWPMVVDSSSADVVRRNRAEEPVIMFLTFDEMYALPQVKEFFAWEKQQLEEMRTSVKLGSS